MAAQILVGTIIFGFIILVLTGIGILTTAIFGISEGKVLQQDPNAIANIKAIPTSATLSQAQLDEIIKSYPTTNIGTGKNNIIDLNGINLSITKISLIAFWIIITLGLMFIIKYLMINY